MAGKGSKPRPVKKSVYDSNFDDIFRKQVKGDKPRGVITNDIYNYIKEQSKK